MDQIGCESVLKSHTTVKQYYYCCYDYYHTILSKFGTEVIDAIVKLGFQNKAYQTVDFIDAVGKKRKTEQELGGDKGFLTDKDKKNTDPTVVMLHNIIWM